MLSFLVFRVTLDTRQDLGCFGHLFVFFLRFQPTAGERRTKEVPTRTDLPRSLEYSAYVAQCYLLTDCRNFIIYYCHRCRASAFRFLLTRTYIRYVERTENDSGGDEKSTFPCTHVRLFVKANLHYIVQNIFSVVSFGKLCAISFPIYWPYVDKEFPFLCFAHHSIPTSYRKHSNFSWYHRWLKFKKKMWTTFKAVSVILKCSAYWNSVSEARNKYHKRINRSLFTACFL